MPKVRSGSSQRWVDHASRATEDYVQGVSNPRVDWATATKNAESTYEQGITDAISKKRFGKGVLRVGSASQIAGAVGKGQQRYAGGITEAQGKYASRVQPYLDVIANTTLPPRGPKGDPRNLDRVKAITTALRNKKLST
jgi:hypothetical protein